MQAMVTIAKLAPADLAGRWAGDWGQGPLILDLRGDGCGDVDIPAHSRGTVAMSAQPGGLLLARIVRQDGMTQAFVVTANAEGRRMEGLYLHYNVPGGAETAMYLDKVGEARTGATPPESRDFNLN